MIAKSVAGFVTQMLKEYVEQIDIEQVTTEIWKGEFRLNNLRLKSETLQLHQIPLRIENGIIGSISGSFPWKATKTDRVQMTIDTVLILCAIDCSDFSAFASLTENMFEKAKNTLHKLYRHGNAELCKFHLRVECGEFSFGMKIETVKMTNANDHAKRFDIDGFGIYLDCGSPLIHSDSPDFESQMIEAMHAEHSWVIAPLSFACDMSSNEGIEQMSFSIEDIKVNLDIETCGKLQCLKKSLELLMKRSRFAGNGRPETFEEADDVNWWRYIHDCAVSMKENVSVNRVLAFLKNRSDGSLEDVKKSLEIYRRLRKEMSEEKLELSSADSSACASVIQFFGAPRDYSLDVKKLVLSFGGDWPSLEVHGINGKLIRSEQTASFVIESVNESGKTLGGENVFEFQDSIVDERRKWVFKIAPPDTCLPVESFEVMQSMYALFGDRILNLLQAKKGELGNVDISLEIAPHQFSFSYKENSAIRQIAIKGESIRGSMVSKSVWQVQTGSYVMGCGGQCVSIEPITILALLDSDYELPSEFADVNLNGCYLYAKVSRVHFGLSHASARLAQTLIALQQVLGSHTLLEISEIDLEVNPMELLATVKLDGIRVQSSKDTIIKAITVAPMVGTTQNVQRVIQLSPDVRISFDENKKEYTVAIDSCSIHVDFAFWQLVVNYFLTLPVCDLSEHVFYVNVANLSVFFPTQTTKKSECLSFALTGTFSFVTGPHVFGIDVSGFSVSVQDVTSGRASLSLTNSIDFQIKTTETDESQLLTISSSDINVKLSPQDWHLFSDIAKNFRKVIYARIVFDDFGAKCSLIKELELNIGQVNLVMCNDGMTLSKITPIFDLEIPAIKLDRTQIDSFTLETAPCLKFFNFTSASWDYLVEPTQVYFVFSCQEKGDIPQTVRIRIDRCYVNLSVAAANELQTFWQQMSKDKQITDGTDLPDFWIGSQLDTTVGVDPGTAPFNITYQEQLPMYGVDSSTVLKIDIGDMKYSVTPRDIVYPTLLSTAVSVYRRSFNGGILLELCSPFELENSLPIPIEVYEERPTNFESMVLLAPGARYPISFASTKPKTFLFKTEKSETTSKYKTISIRSDMIESLTYSIANAFTCCICTYFDTTRGVKVFKLFPPVVFINRLPMNVYVSYTDKEPPVLVQSNEERPLLFHDRSARKFSASFSLDCSSFQKKQSLRQLNDSVHSVTIYNPLQDTVFNAFLMFESDIQDGRLTITLLAPVIFKNVTMSALTVKDSDSDYSKCLFPSSVELWCPPTFLKKQDRLMIDVMVVDISRPLKDAVDCTSFGDAVLFLPCIEETKADLRVPIRCHSESVNGIYVLSFGPVLRIMNELSEQISLVPIKDLGECAPIGDVFSLDPGSGVTIDEIPESGCFILAVSGYKNVTEICLLQEVRTVCQVRNETEVYLVELEIQITSNGLLATFRKPGFPAPIMINNGLSLPLLVYQDTKEFSLTVDPSTSTRFGFEKPFGHLNLHFVIGERVFEREFADDVDFEELGRIDEMVLFITIHTIACGMKMITITDTDETRAGVPLSHTLLTCNCLRISLINRQMQELLSMTFEGIRRNFLQMSNGVIVETSVIDSIQVDDPNPRASVPVIFYSDSEPAIRHEMVIHTENTGFWRVIYANSSLGSFELNIDSSLVTDIIEYAKEIYAYFKDIRLLVHLPSLAFGVDWIEASSIKARVTYRATTDRPTVTSQIDRYLRCLPSVIRCPFTVQEAAVVSFTGTYNTVLLRLCMSAMKNIFTQVMEQFGQSEQSRVQIQKLASYWHIPFSSDEKAVRVFHRNDNDMCLSESLIREKKRVIEQYKLNPSNVIEALESAKGNENEEEVTILERGRMALSEMLNITRRRSSSVGLATTRSHKGGPRCFIDNRISVYNEEVASAQLVIWRRGMLTERIRMYCRCKVTNRFVCCTDQFVFLLSPNIQEIVYEIFVGHISSIDAVNNEVRIVGKKKTDLLTVRCEDGSAAQKMKVFVKSQWCMCVIFSRSVL